MPCTVSGSVDLRRLISGSLSPPLPPSAALSLSLLDSHVHGTSNSGRTLGKMKRFLSTLVQFGNDIAPDTGDRVRALVFSLVVRSLSFLWRV